MWVNFFQDTGLFVSYYIKKIAGQTWVASNTEMFQPDLQSEVGLSIPKEECPTKQVLAVGPVEIWRMCGSFLILIV